MGQFVEDMEGYVRDDTPPARPISVFDMQAQPSPQPAPAVVQPAAKKAADEGSNK